MSPRSSSRGRRARAGPGARARPKPGTKMTPLRDELNGQIVRVVSFMVLSGPSPAAAVSAPPPKPPLRDGRAAGGGLSHEEMDRVSTCGKPNMPATIVGHVVNRCIGHSHSRTGAGVEHGDQHRISAPPI